MGYCSDTNSQSRVRSEDLYSPAMDEELLKIMITYIAYYNMYSSHSDVEQ